MTERNEEMVKQTRQPRKEPFKIDDMVAIQISLKCQPSREETADTSDYNPNRRGRQNESCTPEIAVGQNNGD